MIQQRIRTSQRLLAMGAFNARYPDALLWEFEACLIGVYALVGDAWLASLGEPAVWGAKLPDGSIAVFKEQA